MPSSLRSLPLLGRLAWFFCILSPLTAPVLAAESAPQNSSESANYGPIIVPLLKRYCLDCHSTEKQKGDLDLERLGTLAEARRHPVIWQSVAEQLAIHEMPPKEKPQPTPAEFRQLSSWVQSLLHEIALTTAGDPGPVILRRLSNAEYTYTLRDLTGVESLDPAREFPVDGAAGEGFMNTGAALVMSPTLLTKYLDAARDIAGHAVLLPDGIRFSPSTSRRDWTDSIVAEIREFYRRYTDPRGSTRVNLQGLVWETNEGGRPPIDRYLNVLSQVRENLGRNTQSLETLARESGLSRKYLGALHSALSSGSPSLVLDRLRQQWAAPSTNPGPIALEIGEWQKALWKFGSVGHIGKVGGPKAWMEPLNPIAPRQDFRLRLTNSPPQTPVTVRLIASDAGDGNAEDLVLWERPRLVAPGRPDLLIRDVRSVARDLADGRARVVSTAAACLAAAAEAEQHPSPETLVVADLAKRHAVDPAILQAWLDMLGIGTGGRAPIRDLAADRIESTGGHAFVQGWGKSETPNFVANASDQNVRIPGNLRAHGFALHPSPTLAAAVAWRSPVAANLRVELSVTHAHPECGNGVTWTLESRRGSTRQRLANGVAQGSKTVRVDPLTLPSFRPGDVLEVLIGPRDGNHSCDLTAVELQIIEITESGNKTPRVWNLAEDVSPDILAGNPHADRLGHADVWHFHTEPVANEGPATPPLPPGSLLARWRSTTDADARRTLASQFQELLSGSPATPADHPDAQLHRMVFAPNGPLFRSLLAQRSTPSPAAPSIVESTSAANPAGLDPAIFGRHPDGSPVDPGSLCLHAPAVIEFQIPAELAAGCEFVTSATLHPQAGPQATAQFSVRILPLPTPHTNPSGPDPTQVFIAAANSPAQRRLESAFDDFRSLFPAALCYTRIVPVDEVVTLTLYFREDDALRRLMLTEEETAHLDRLWEELHFVAQDALTLVDAYAQLMEYATQDADPKVFEPLRGPIHARAAEFRKRLVGAEPRHLDAVLALAPKAYRRPLRSGEESELRALYSKLRSQELPHEEAIRMTLARLFVAPAFLYRTEEPRPGPDPHPVSDWELANRLSYFLWSSAPDETLRAAAAANRLSQSDTLIRETRRMLRDPKVRRLAVEFGCQWLHIRGFDELDEKSERHFPTFATLRAPIYEEAIRFFTDFFQNDQPVHSLLDGDHTFLNQELAEFYGISGITGPEWRRVDHMGTHHRGGVLGLAATLAKQSGASRTSPILRGNWVSEVLLGEKLPRPPKDVPRLPEDEAATEGLTVRQLVERHSQDPRCAGCHVRIDPYGFALEGFDAIGRYRTRDLADRPISTQAKTGDGATFQGLDGLRSYLLRQRGPTFSRHFARKLLGYSLGRAVQLSDRPLLDKIQETLESGDGRVGSAVETIVLSRQFRECRGRDSTLND